MVDLLDDLQAALAASYGHQSAARMIASHRENLARHGDFSRWQESLSALPSTQTGWHISDGRLVAGAAVDDLDSLGKRLHTFVPWRKGPLVLGGVAIDTEWRSDWKWSRIAPHLALGRCRVLDVGAGNGYFGWRMLDHGAAEVIGCDPSPLFCLQHAVARHFAGTAPQHLLCQRLEDLPEEFAGFDVVFSMGVLYHRRRPLAHLADLRRRLAPEGVLVLETLIAPGAGRTLLATPERYAGMRNVHGLPSLSLLLEWVENSGFAAARCVDTTATTTDEQRRTEWMPFHSLAEALDPDHSNRTREGFPAPLRAMVLACNRAAPLAAC